MRKIILILSILSIAFCSDISMQILEIEGEYEQRYISALNAVLGPESYKVEANAIIKKDKTQELPTNIPIQFLPGLGINIESIPKDIALSKPETAESIKSIDIILTLDEILNDSLVALATSTIENHILYKKIKNNLIVNRANLYKTPEQDSPIINIESQDISSQDSFSNRSIVGGLIIGAIILLGLIVLVWFINKIYNNLIDFTESQLEGQDAVRLALEEGLSSSGLALEGREEESIIEDNKEDIEIQDDFIDKKIDEPVITKQDSLDGSGSLESVFREVGSDIIEAITNIAEPVTSSVKEAISESTDLELYQKNPFDFLGVLDESISTKVIEEESPGSSAIALSHLEPQKAASILSKVNVDAQLKIAQNMATMEGSSKEILQTVKKQFREKVSAMLKPDFTPLDGVDMLSNILHHMKQENSESILFSISQTNKSISDNIRKKIGFFSDVLTLNPDEIDKLLNKIDTNTLSYALVDCDESISDKLLNSLSKSGKNSLKRKITLLEDADPRMIEKSRKIIGESILMITEVEE